MKINTLGLLAGVDQLLSGLAQSAEKRACQCAPINATTEVSGVLLINESRLNFYDSDDRTFSIERSGRLASRVNEYKGQ